MKENHRKFKVFAERLHDSTGIGIEEYMDDGEYMTVSIASLYYDRRLSNQNTMDAFLFHVYHTLEPGETAILRVSRPTVAKRKWLIPYIDRIKTKSETFNQGKRQAYQLARDAIKRKSDITEAFREGNGGGKNDKFTKSNSE